MHHAIKGSRTTGAVPLGNLEVIKELIKAGAAVNAKNKRERSPLQEALQEFGSGIIKILIESGANVNATDIWGRTSLHDAAFWADSNFILLLIKSGANVNVKDKMGRTPLHYTRDADSAHLLISSGADPNAKDNDGINIISFAFKFGNIELVKQLMKDGAKLETQSVPDQKSWYHILSDVAELKQETKSKETGAKSDEKRKSISTDEGNLERKLYHAVEKGDVEAVRKLIKEGVHLNAKVDAFIPTALMRAVSEQRFNIAYLLIESAADINVRDFGGRSTLWFAIEYGDVKLVRTLIQKGANVNLTGYGSMDVRGFPTLLSVAYQRGDPAIIKELIKAGAR